MSLSLSKHIRLARKKARLSVEDMEHILDIPGERNLDKYEKGFRSWNIPMVIKSHLVFNVPLIELFQRYIQDVTPDLCIKISQRLVHLHNEAPTPKRNHRKAFLESVIKRLTEIKAYE